MNKQDDSITSDNQKPSDIAIIGLSCRFPGAKNYTEFWNNLVAGIDNSCRIPSNRWDKLTRDEEKSCDSDAHWGCFVDGIDQFDASFFGISPHEAKIMDPQQRLLLELVWTCLEDAGYAPLSLVDKNMGVFIGTCNPDYKKLLDKYAQGNPEYYIAGLANYIVANRISYFFDFHGPSMCIDTACSSSLVAIHQAVRAIQFGECNTALVGGANLLCDPTTYRAGSSLGILSTTGQCRSFEKNADGYVRGEGVGVILLKPLKLAQHDNNIIYGVIKGTAVNHGARSRSLTAPNPYLQSKVIVNAWKQADISPDRIDYLEAHGTATPLGDPIEMIGLQRAMKQLAKHYQVTLAEHFCNVGTVKTNIGHLEAAAGIAGLIKVVLALKNGYLPKLLHFQEMNAHINLEKTPFYLSKDGMPWPKKQNPRVAGISSFGIGGTNAHMVIEEAPSPSKPLAEENKVSSSYYLLALSAKKPESLKQVILDLGKWLVENQQVSLEALTYSYNVRREHFNYRCAFVFDSMEALQRQLAQASFTQPNKNISSDKEALTYYDQLKATSPHSLERKSVLESLAKRYLDNCHLDFEKIYPKDTNQWLQIPTYPFLKTSYWYNSDKGLETNVSLNPASDKKIIKLQILDHEIAIMHLQDRAHRNQMSTEFLIQLKEILGKVNNNSTIKVLIVTGYDDVFCLGGDETNLKAIAQQETNYTSMPIVYQGLLSCKIPVISAMQGHAFGAGLAFGLFADIVILSQEHTYTANFMNYGITPGVGSTLILREKLSLALANEMMWTGREYRGYELAQRGAPVLFKASDEVLSEAINIAQSLIKKPLLSLQVFKQSTASYLLQKLPRVIDEEIGMHQEVFQSSEAKEHIEAHFATLQKWKGESRNQVRATEKTKVVLKNISKVKNSEEAVFPNQENMRQQNQPQPVPQVKNKTQIEECEFLLREILAEQLHMPVEEIHSHSEFQELGIDSIVMLMLVDKINKQFGLQLASFALYDYKNIDTLATFIIQELEKKQTVSQSLPNKNVYPTTTRQRRWFRLSMKGMPLDEFNIIARISWKAPLDLSFLEKSLNVLIQEQAMLRTQFVFEEDELYQEIVEPIDKVHFEIESQLHMPEEQREQHIKKRYEYYNRAIPFTSYPLWKLVLIPFAENHSELLIITSHLIMDVYSVALLSKQLFTYYMLLKQGQKPVISKLKMSFVDYVQNQQQQYQSPQYASDLKYWQDKLAQPQKKVYLDDKLVADPSLDFSPGFKQCILGVEHSKQIKKLADQHSCTDTSFFLALLRIILLRYTKIADIWIDVVDALRQANTMALIGWTATTYPHITTITAEDSFIDLMKKVQKEFMLVKQHAQLPLSSLVYPDSQRFRDEITAIQFNRIADLDLFFDNFPAIEKVEFPTLPKFFCYNLTCLVTEKNSKLSFGFLYNANQFSSEKIETILEDCQALLAHIISNKDSKILEMIDQALIDISC